MSADIEERPTLRVGNGKRDFAGIPTFYGLFT